MKNQENPPIDLVGYCPFYGNGTWNHYTLLSLCDHLAGDQLTVRLIQLASHPCARRAYSRNAIPYFLLSVAYRLNPSQKLLKRYGEHVYLKSLRTKSVAYVWPGISMATLKRLKQRGHSVVLERINCHQAVAKQILDNVYREFPNSISHSITEERIEIEREEISLVDYVFSPSPMVKQSLLDNGVPTEKILESSYGWDPERLSKGGPAISTKEGLTVLFVGTGNARKGLHVLLKAWARAAVPGRLLIAGHVMPEIESVCHDLLQRSDVVRLGHVSDIGSVYRSADVFAFPSFEEGGPLVSYEALGSGLPALVSPMGAGAIVRHEQDGLILDPCDVDAWTNAIRHLYADGSFRKALAVSAANRALDFTWDKVGQRRRELLLSRLSR